jgi:beta-galactosidase
MPPLKSPASLEINSGRVRENTANSASRDYRANIFARVLAGIDPGRERRLNFMVVKKFALAILAALAIASAPAAIARDILPLDDNWRFFKGDAAGAEQPVYDDSQWKSVSLPHDWSIAGPFAQTNLAGGAGAFLPSGVAWYRKHFSLPSNTLGRRVFVEFDGVMQNSDVWINGLHLGHRPSGYVSFRYELPNTMLSFGGGPANILTVCADTSAQPASRWYAGAGIYRHARIVVENPVHIAADGVFVTTPKISAAGTTVQVEVTVTNESSAPHDINVQASLLAPDGSPVGSIVSSQNIEAGASATLDLPIVFANPQLWNLDQPSLYQAVTKIHSDDMLADEQTTTFGIRDAHFDADTGFWLNGKNFKLKGVCLHADGGAFGAAVPLSIWEARLTTLKSLGVSAIRTAHNPPAPEFLDLCDRLGLLVMDEFFDCWTVGKNHYDYHLYFNDWSQTDERDTILRDRNHPSIIIYSVGNEIHDTPQAELAKGILSNLVAVAHATDPSRPVTQALFRPNVSHDYEDGLADMLDVVGQNYRENEILAAHDQKPTRKILGTENTHVRQQWVAMRDNAPYAGQFLWTGIDYLGESRRWPIIGHGSGLLDRTGAIRPLGRERQSWWSDEPMVAIARRISQTDEMPADPGYGTEERHTQVLFSDWTPKNLKPHGENVEVYSNCKQVELFLNGKSLGKKEINTDASPRDWQVPFSPGTLRAVAWAGKFAITNELRTAGKPARIVLTAENKKLSPDWNDVAAVRATVVDSRDITIPRASDLISFKLQGPAVIAAVDNADNASDELFQTNSRHAFQGQCVAFVKASAPSGKIILTATASGLKPGSFVIRAGVSPGTSSVMSFKRP